MSWLLKTRGTPAQKQVDGTDTVKALQKLKGFFDIAKEALQHAVACDEQGDAQRALKLYKTALEACDEGLKLPARSVGLNPDAGSAAAWRTQLCTWRDDVQDRIRELESGARTRTSIKLQRARSLTTPPQPRTSAPGTAPAAAPQRAAKSARQAVPAAAPPAPPRSSSAGREDDKYRQAIMSEVLDGSPSVKWDDVAGLALAKQALQEAVILPTLRADIFQGLRAPVRGILLYGPPGNGKTLLGKALASEARATFFSISASSLTSKWVGDGEKMVRAMFQVAAERQPSIVFIDEIDSILSARSANEHDAMRRLKTEFLVQFDGVASGDARIVVIGATNRPQELDDAVRRRLVKRIYIPLPDEATRRAVLRHLLQGQNVRMGGSDIEKVVRATDLYSASDLTALCKEAAMGPVRELGAAIAGVSADSLRPIQLADFSAAIRVIRPSTNMASVKAYEEFTEQYGTA